VLADGALKPRHLFRKAAALLLDLGELLFESPELLFELVEAALFSRKLVCDLPAVGFLAGDLPPQHREGLLGCLHLGLNLGLFQPCLFEGLAIGFDFLRKFAIPPGERLIFCIDRLEPFGVRGRWPRRAPLLRHHAFGRDQFVEEPRSNGDIFQNSSSSDFDCERRAQVGTEPLDLLRRSWALKVAAIRA